MKNLEWGQIWPSLNEFADLGKSRRVVPVVTKILVDDAAPVGLYRALADSRVGTFLLESAESDGTWSRWSFIGVAARAWMTTFDGTATWHGDVPEGLLREGTTMEVLESALTELTSEPIDGLPPLTGGLVGTLGWDTLYDWWPDLRRKAPQEHTTPDAALCLADDLVVVDHRENCVWIVANAINRNNTPEGIERAYEDAVARVHAVRENLNRPASAHAATMSNVPAPQPQWRVSEEEFVAALDRAKAYIEAGEAEQIVVSQRADIDSPADPLDVYRVLRAINPSPYMLFLRLPDGTESGFTIVGSSPETLIRVTDGQAMTFPIGGTRPRPADPLDDARVIEELKADPKEVNEHMMLVELSKSDLAKVCDPQSIEVVDLMAIKVFSHVIHITSTVIGTLNEGTTIADCLAATFPAGTLSGSPKQRSVEIIDELEASRRGIFGGVTGYFDFSGNADLAITIRTAIVKDGKASVQAGAGVVAESDSHYEYTETQNKAGAAIRAIQLASQLSESAFSPGA
ncbi:chorismate-binding protein [Trueperella bialowiezensis]|uniref:Anthranilate synthase component 1 n=1 Tax=Trueperella bialowiezensis TaxID=312285 RepID=A0A3S4WEZ7_9ACTO|nr:chorismate-binding protein [Trueperella bialowiezensis]VEI12385.1 Anthranilate synthase component 1 [Trueperella bialowiezensis]